CLLRFRKTFASNASRRSGLRDRPGGDWVDSHEPDPGESSVPSPKPVVHRADPGWPGGVIVVAPRARRHLAISAHESHGLRAACGLPDNRGYLLSQPWGGSSRVQIRSAGYFRAPRSVARYRGRGIRVSRLSTEHALGLAHGAGILRGFERYPGEPVRAPGGASAAPRPAAF